MEPIILAVTGASAIELAERSLQLLLQTNQTVYLVLSKAAYTVSKAERNIAIPISSSKQEVFWRERLCVKSGFLKCLKWNDHSSSIASGSFRTKAMIILPCSMGTLGRIACGNSVDLIERCADVHLKERRKLIIAPRESPFSVIHLRNMLTLAEAGANIVPPIPAWYSNPKNLEEMVNFIVVRLFDSLGEQIGEIKRWDK
tara:strand:- start:247 stop:846 length:600 start_codon:yes stop_codon:yes gene_type:complete